MTDHTRGYGWVPSLPDHRDQAYGLSVPTLGLPPKIDLTAELPPAWDQGQIGSCTGHGVGGLALHAQLKVNPKAPAPSRLFIYYNERVLESTIRSDSGAQIRDGLKVLANQGVPPETLWPYDVTKFKNKPVKKAYSTALKHKATAYHAVNSGSVKATLAAGYPVVIGFTVYTAFESQEVANTGVLNMPGPQESVLGGHCVLVMGYDDSTQRYLIRNSWGTAWGKDGHFTMPYEYLSNSSLSSDFWTITVEA